MRYFSISVHYTVHNPTVNAVSTIPPKSDSIYTVKKVLADFAVLYLIDDAIAKLYVT